VITKEHVLKTVHKWRHATRRGRSDMCYVWRKGGGVGKCDATAIT